MDIPLFGPPSIDEPPFLGEVFRLRLKVARDLRSGTIHTKLYWRTGGFFGHTSQAEPSPWLPTGGGGYGMQVGYGEIGGGLKNFGPAASALYLHWSHEAVATLRGTSVQSELHVRGGLGYGFVFEPGLFGLTKGKLGAYKYRGGQVGWGWEVLEEEEMSKPRKWMP